jgi:hypothetical protein
MAINYTRAELLCKIESAKSDMASFYNQDFINYTGKTSDTDEYYTEVICEWLINNMDMLNRIPMIERKKGYKMDTHDGVIDNPNSGRTEEMIAMQMFTQKEISLVGTILDYQTPLKNKRSDKAGKVDLLSCDGHVLRILELKEPESTETMLRCVIEGYTYMKTVYGEGLIDSFDLPDGTIIKTNPLVHINSKQHAEIVEGRPKLQRLIEMLDAVPLYYDFENEKYVITEG